MIHRLHATWETDGSQRLRNSSYLDALSAITDEMSLKERSNLIFLDRCLHELWGLGQNVILNWCPDGDGIALLVIPHYGVAAYSTQVQGRHGVAAGGTASKPKQDFFQALVNHARILASTWAKLFGLCAFMPR